MDRRRAADHQRRERSLSRSRARLRLANRDLVIVASDDVSPLIPPGTYDAIGGTAKPARQWNTDKLRVLWTVLVPDTGAEFGIRRQVLTRHYNVSVEDGRIRAGANSDYVREWMLASNVRPRRLNRMSPAVFRGLLFEVAVRTVVRDHRHTPLAECGTYSVIGHLIRRKTGPAAPE